MWHTEFNLITAYPARLGKTVMFIEAEFRPEAENGAGSLGMTLCTNLELGVAILRSVWRSGDFLLMNKDALEPGREEAVRRATGTISAERHRLPGVDLELSPAGRRRRPARAARARARSSSRCCASPTRASARGWTSTATDWERCWRPGTIRSPAQRCSGSARPGPC
jgi:hypothetical protein